MLRPREGGAFGGAAGTGRGNGMIGPLALARPGSGMIGPLALARAARSAHRAASLLLGIGTWLAFADVPGDTAGFFPSSTCKF